MSVLSVRNLLCSNSDTKQQKHSIRPKLLIKTENIEALAENFGRMIRPNVVCVGKHTLSEGKESFGRIDCTQSLSTW